MMSRIKITQKTTTNVGEEKENKTAECRSSLKLGDGNMEVHDAILSSFMCWKFSKVNNFLKQTNTHIWSRILVPTFPG